LGSIYKNSSIETLLIGNFSKKWIHFNYVSLYVVIFIYSFFVGIENLKHFLGGVKFTSLLLISSSHLKKIYVTCKDVLLCSNNKTLGKKNITSLIAKNTIDLLKHNLHSLDNSCIAHTLARYLTVNSSFKKRVYIKYIEFQQLYNFLVINGIVIKKHTVVPGSFLNKNQYLLPSILVIDFELKSSILGKSNLRIKGTYNLINYLNKIEWFYFYKKLSSCLGSGCNIIISTSAIDSISSQFFTDHHILSIPDVGKSQIYSISVFLHSIVTPIHSLIESHKPMSCHYFEIQKHRQFTYYFFIGLRNYETMTILIDDSYEKQDVNILASVRVLLNFFKVIYRKSKLDTCSLLFDLIVIQNLRKFSKEEDFNYFLLKKLFADAFEDSFKQLMLNYQINHRILSDLFKSLVGNSSLIMSDFTFNMKTKKIHNLHYNTTLEFTYFKIIMLRNIFTLIKSIFNYVFINELILV